MCLFVNILSFDTCVILERDERESKNSQKIVQNAKALDFQRVFQLKSHRISTSAAEVFSALIENIATFGPVMARVKAGYDGYIR